MNTNEQAKTASVDMTAELVERLRGLLAKATPGPWSWSENGNILGHMPDGYDETREVAAVYTNDEATGAPNAPLIIAAVNALHTLLNTLAAQEAELAGVRADAAERVRLHHYWRQRAKSAEGHLFASDLTHAAMAIHARSLKAEIPWEELDWREKNARLGCAMDVIARVNQRRDERLPKDTNTTEED